jgi:hypothetical protein
LNKYRKAISAGLTATLLASLFTMVAASTAFGATTVTSAGSVPRGGTSTGTVTITLTENAASCLAEGVDPAASTISIFDVDDPVPAGPSEVSWSGTPVVSAPGSLAATATIAANVLTVDTDNSSDAVQEQIVITGLTITAAAGAEPGAIVAALVDNTAGDGGAANGGPNCWTATTRTATGTISVGIAAGSTTVLVNVTGSCSFVLSAGTPSGLIFATLPETVEITAAPAIGTPPAGPGQQSLTIDATANNHQLGEAVSQTGVPVSGTCPATLSSPGTVVDALNQTATSVQVFPGENNQVAGTTTVAEVNTGFLAAGTVVTFTLTPDGVLFSGGALSPTLTAAGAGFALTSGTCAVSVDRKSCTATVDTAATPAGNFGSILLSAIRLDVAPTVPAGTAVKAVVTTSPTKAVNVTSNTIAIVSRIIVGVAAQPTIFFNQNDQPTGQISLTETGAGFFTAGPGPTNVFSVCLASGESFTRAPWAVVTVGDLKLFSGVVGAASSKGTLFNSNTCARWAVFSASTVASTIEIRGTDAADVVLPSGSLNGPRVNVGPASTTFAPGPTLIDIRIGTLAQITAVPPTAPLTTQVSNAIRAFKNQPVVAAVSQVVLPPGTTNGVMGNITITETQAGQFKANDTCFITILPQSQPAGNAQVVTFVGGVTSNVPLVTTNVGSGLLVGAVTSFTANDADFGFTITQQAVGTLGVITISNMHVSVLGDALPTIVQVRVDCDPVGGGVDINQVVSPARIGNPVAGTAATRLGVTQVGAFTTATKIQRVRRYVTYRLDFGVAAAGQAVQIWGATKTGNDWSAFTVVTTRIANASGVVYYYIRHNSATWRSYRGFWVGGGSWTPARQARWIP